MIRCIPIPFLYAVFAAMCVVVADDSINAMRHQIANAVQTISAIQTNPNPPNNTSPLFSTFPQLALAEAQSLRTMSGEAALRLTRLSAQQTSNEHIERIVSYAIRIETDAAAFARTALDAVRSALHISIASDLSRMRAALAAFPKLDGQSFVESAAQTAAQNAARVDTLLEWAMADTDALRVLRQNDTDARRTHFLAEALWKAQKAQSETAAFQPAIWAEREAAFGALRLARDLEKVEEAIPTATAALGRSNALTQRAEQSAAKATAALREALLLIRNGRNTPIDNGTRRETLAETPKRDDAPNGTGWNHSSDELKRVNDSLNQTAKRTSVIATNEREDTERDDEVNRSHSQNETNRAGYARIGQTVLLMITSLAMFVFV